MYPNDFFNEDHKVVHWGKKIFQKFLKLDICMEKEKKKRHLRLHLTKCKKKKSHKIDLDIKNKTTNIE